MVVTDKEATDYSLLVNYSFQKINPSTTMGDYKNDIVKEIFTTILNQRLRELTQKENPPFIFAATQVLAVMQEVMNRLVVKLALVMVIL